MHGLRFAVPIAIGSSDQFAGSCLDFCGMLLEKVFETSNQQPITDNYSLSVQFKVNILFIVANSSNTVAGFVNHIFPAAKKELCRF